MSTIAQMIANAASAAGVPAQLAVEVGIQESSLSPTAVSPKGAIGVMQLMPATAAQLGVDPTDAQQNIQGGVTYLSQLYQQFGSWDAALAAYNWGPGNVASAQSAYGSDWLSYAPSETQNYVSTILGNAGMSADDSGSAYQAGISPASILGGVTGAPVDNSTILLLTLAALGLYIVFDFFTD